MITYQYYGKQIALTIVGLLTFLYQTDYRPRTPRTENFKAQVLA